MALSMKVYLQRPFSASGPIIHRLELSEPHTYSDLFSKVEETAGVSVTNLRWRDNEKDLISLRNDEDLRLAIEHARTHNDGLLKVHATIYDAPAKRFRRCLSCGEQRTDETAADDESEAGPPQRKEEKGYPVRELPGGGRYTGYVRATGPDGKTVERELSMDEVEDFLHREVRKAPEFGNPWKACRQPSFPAFGFGYNPFPAQFF